MNYIEKIVHREHLKDDVLCFWQMHGNIPPPGNIHSRHLPKGQNLLIFNFGDEVELLNPTKDKALNTPFFVVPAIASSQLINQTGEINVFGISFIGEGLYKLMQLPITKLGNRFPETLLPNYQALFDRLKNLNFEEKATLAEDFLLKNINQKISSKKFILAVEKINSTNGKIQVNGLANELKVSERQLQRLFKTRMGISPKDYCKIVRVNNYLDFVLEKGHSIDWMDLVVQFDYHDQPHLINELKSISQLSPQKLLRLRDTLYHRYTLD